MPSCHESWRMLIPRLRSTAAGQAVAAKDRLDTCLRSWMQTQRSPLSRKQIQIFVQQCIDIFGSQVLQCWYYKRPHFQKTSGMPGAIYGSLISPDGLRRKNIRNPNGSSQPLPLNRMLHFFSAWATTLALSLRRFGIIFPHRDGLSWAAVKPLWFMVAILATNTFRHKICLMARLVSKLTP